MCLREPTSRFPNAFFPSPNRPAAKVVAKHVKLGLCGEMHDSKAQTVNEFQARHYTLHVEVAARASDNPHSLG